MDQFFLRSASVSSNVARIQTSPVKPSGKGSHWKPRPSIVSSFQLSSSTKSGSWSDGLVLTKLEAGSKRLFHSKIFFSYTSGPPAFMKSVQRLYQKPATPFAWPVPWSLAHFWSIQPSIFVAPQEAFTRPIGTSSAWLSFQPIQ